MTTSPNFSYNRDQVIRRMLRLVGAIQSGETPGAQENQDAIDALNAMVSEWQATGLHLWKETEGILFLQPNQIQYGLGGSGSDHAAAGTANSAVTSWVQTNLTANAAAGATALLVAGINTIAAGDKIGILLANNTLFWTTVNGAPSGFTIHIANALPSAASAGAFIADYSASIIRPLRVVDARRFYIPSGIETPLILMSRLDYRELPNKTNTGVVTQMFYDPQLSTGQAWVWPAPSDSLSAIKFTWMEPIFNFNVAGDQPDFPVEWFNCLVWNGAKEIMLEYDVPDARAQKIFIRAKETFDLVSGFDREPESIFFGVNFDQSSR